MLKIGVLGVGHLGSIHARLWASQPRAVLAGIFDADRAKAEAKAAELGVACFNDVQSCIAECDAVTIAVPTIYHEQVAMECIEAGKHCLIEKPITHSVESAERLLAAASAKGVCIQVGHVERFNPALRAALKYGLEPRFIEAHRLSQFRPRATDVSVIHDLMIHDIDIVLSLVKSPVVRVIADGVSVLTETVDLVHARIDFQNGAVANLTASRLSASPMRKMRIFQKGMYLSVDFAKPALDVFRMFGDDESDIPANGTLLPASMLGDIDHAPEKTTIMFEQPAVEQRNAIADEQAAFVESILDAVPVTVSGSDALAALRIASQLEEQIRGRR
ncbi:MAG: Gfo/Idh/MocA family oxidoreductase [Candidatus Kapaibacterium sp.]|jgi:predicted dehydrogenase